MTRSRSECGRLTSPNSASTPHPPSTHTRAPASPNRSTTSMTSTASITGTPSQVARRGAQTGTNGPEMSYQRSTRTDRLPLKSPTTRPRALAPRHPPPAEPNPNPHAKPRHHHLHQKTAQPEETGSQPFAGNAPSNTDVQPARSHATSARRF